MLCTLNWHLMMCCHHVVIPNSCSKVRFAFPSGSPVLNSWPSTREERLPGPHSARTPVNPLQSTLNDFTSSSPFTSLLHHCWIINLQADSKPLESIRQNRPISRAPVEPRLTFTVLLRHVLEAAEDDSACLIFFSSASCCQGSSWSSSC